MASVKRRKAQRARVYSADSMALYTVGGLLMIAL